MKLSHTFNDLPIRYKLLISYPTAFFCVILLGSLVINFQVKKTIESNIESELQNSTSAILNLVRTSVSVSTKNYLRAIAEKNRDILTLLAEKQKNGELGLQEAKRLAGEILLSQKVGKSGYIYVGNSYGTAILHPDKEVEGSNFATWEFVKKIMIDKSGYIEYDWKNPGESRERPKSIYLAYFEPWDWIICVSSYREEFRDLVDLEDLKDSILSFRFGDSGYSFVANANGELVIHPKGLAGINFYQSKEHCCNEIATEMLSRRNGKLVYNWKNPGESESREKLVIFNFLDQYDWLVASSGYLDEIYAPLRKVQNLVVITGLLSLLAVSVLTLWVSSLITNPLVELMNRLADGSRQDFTARVRRRSKDELGRLAWHFNRFMEKLEEYSSNIIKEVAERKSAEDALRQSEEMFSKAFSSSPNGIFIISLNDVRYINVNDSFVAFTGYDRDEIIGKTLGDIPILSDVNDGYDMINGLVAGHHLHSREFTYVTKDGERRIGVISAEIIELWEEPAMLATIEDITNKKALEREVMEISERERQQIGQNLHDDLCPHLIGIEVLGNVHENRLHVEGNPEAATARKIKGLIGEAIEKTRSMARGLCPVHLIDHGFQNAIKELTLNIKNIYNITCDFKAEIETDFEDSITATHLLYITQEALQNAIRHGSATKIAIELRERRNKLCLTIVDNGSGLPERLNSKGMGFKIMKFRAKIIGAVLELYNHEAGGTVVEIIFPSVTAN